MQVIIADTTPLNYLVLIQAADILPNLYRTVLIPPAIHSKVRAWISTKSNGGAKGHIMPPSLHAFSARPELFSATQVMLRCVRE